MNMTAIRSFFLWCTVVNAGLFFLAFLVCTLAGGWVYRMHSRCFPMPRETFNVVLYLLFGLYKLAIMVFNVVPYVALVILG